MGTATGEGRGRHLREQVDGATSVTAADGTCLAKSCRLMEAVVGRANMVAAYRRVHANKGAAGVDGMDVDALWDYCQAHWPQVKAELLE